MSATRCLKYSAAIIPLMLLCLLVQHTEAAFVPTSVVSTTQQSPSIARLSRQVGTSRHDRWRLLLSEQPQAPPPPENATDAKEQQTTKLPFFLDVNTKGGVVVYTIVLFIIPILFYNFVTENFDIEEGDAGRFIGAGFTLVATILWTSTYIFRVANKGMTYAKQLKDYEDGVIARRLAELDDDEVQALMEDIERDDF